MDTQKIIKTARKLADIVHREFPHIFVDDAREAIAKTLVNLHIEPEILGQLFADSDVEIVAKMGTQGTDCDLV